MIPIWRKCIGYENDLTVTQSFHFYKVSITASIRIIRDARIFYDLVSFCLWLGTINTGKISGWRPLPFNNIRRAGGFNNIKTAGGESNIRINYIERWAWGYLQF